MQQRRELCLLIPCCHLPHPTGPCGVDNSSNWPDVVPLLRLCRGEQIASTGLVQGRWRLLLDGEAWFALPFGGRGDGRQPEEGWSRNLSPDSPIHYR